ncbi:hypothetical protein DH2020_013484 [Rehmannia glutinosa]|uniref:Uncharacterized protein n=1 Tax=Rehmannia glutinosa TaxID=99300 RepID=A0ABR0X324_REHGL
MRCINCESLHYPLFSEQHNDKHQNWPANKLPCMVKANRNSYRSLVSLRTRAAPALAAALQPAGKLSVLLQTSAVCLFAYWVANFVMPEIILKDLRSKNSTNEDAENPEEGD